MAQDEDDEEVFQEVFGQPKRESYIEDFLPDDDQDEQISASIQQAQLKPNSRKKFDNLEKNGQRVSLMDRRF